MYRSSAATAMPSPGAPLGPTSITPDNLSRPHVVVDGALNLGRGYHCHLEVTDMGAEHRKSDGELEVVDAETGRILWRGRPEGHDVWTVLPLPRSNDAIVLLTWSGMRRGDFQNLIRIRPDGSIVWMAPLPRPGTGDAYTAVSWGTSGLSAGSWSGYHVILEPKTGRILSREFVK